MYSGRLHFKQSIDMNKMISECDLILVVSLVKIFIKHLYEGFFRVKFPLIVLWVNIDLTPEFLGFSDTHDLPPIGE